MTYTEYTDGTILLTQSSFEFNYTVTTNEHYIGSGGSSTKITIKATCAGPGVTSGYFELRDLVYSVSSTTYDVIIDPGTPYFYGGCSLHTAYTPVLQETASSSAYVQYRLNFLAGPTGYYTVCSLLTFTLKNNSTNVSHVELQ